MNARDLLERAKDAMIDADALSRAGGSLVGTALRASDAAHLAARALLVPLDLDRADPLAATLLVDMRLVATEKISRAAGEALHRALRAGRECREADPVALFLARVDALREGARLLIAESDIVLGRDAAVPRAAGASGAAPGGHDDDEESLP